MGCSNITGINFTVSLLFIVNILVWENPSLRFHPNLLFLKTVKLLRVHDGPVTGLSLHATGDYVLSTSTDQHWAFSDIRQGQLIAKVTDESAGREGIALTCAQFHPDGLIFGTGTSDSLVKIWDLKEVNSVNSKRTTCRPLSSPCVTILPIHHTSSLIIVEKQCREL